ncbi:SLBB domain-containing protein [Thermoflavifilum thermophilum]|nr:SLBB domain-containing protein [Thermoflavifilum thermophilum]
MLRFLRHIAAICLCLGLFMHSFAQNLPSGAVPMNLGNVQVDQLSDEQVRQFMLQAQQSGLSDAQIAQMALARGMSTTELQKLQARIARIRAQDSLQLQSLRQAGLQDTGLHRFGYVSGDTTSVARLMHALDALRPHIFGEELFRNPNLTFEPDLNIPTPKNYQVGPGDEIVIDIYGYSEASYRLIVSKEGSINIPYIGIVYVNGLTIDEAAQRIKSKLSTVYSTIATGKTSVQVSIGRIRSIKVTLLGEITQPGTYTLPSLATVFNALYASGGPTPNGSFRDIEVIRNNKVIDTVDVYDFLMKGDQSKNIRLQDQDVIRVPVYQTHVLITGQIKRPGIYELKPQETLSDLLHYAGGFTDSAYTASIKAVQLTPTQKKVTDIPANQYVVFQPQNGDQYYVSSILDRYLNRVIIQGAVYRPGTFALTQGLTLKQLIEKADGLREDAFLPRGYIVRLNPDLTTSIVQFNVANIMNGTDPDITLQREDVVQIYSIFDLRDQYTVSIEGAVRNPGTYRYADSMTLEDLIMQAGGFQEGATPRKIEVARRVKNSNPLSDSARLAQVFEVSVNRDFSLKARQFILQPFDVVVVRLEPGYEVQKQVRIEGEVLYPGIYTLTSRNERISDLIKRAGGLTAFAYPEGASLRRPYKNLADTSLTPQERMNILARLQGGITTDSTSRLEQMEMLQRPRNELVGIELKEILQHPGSKYDLILKEGDVITIPSELQTVQINGEVLYPSSTPFEKGRGVKYYISRAGGFSLNAKKNRVYVLYANGFVKGTGHFLFIRDYPKVEPGAQIFVPRKPERQKVTVGEVFGFTSSVVSLTAAILAIVRLL